MRRRAAADPRTRQAAGDAVAQALEVAAFAVPAAMLLGWTGAGVWWMADRFGPWAWALAVVVPTVWALPFWWLTRPEPSRGQAQPVERCAPRLQATVPRQSSGSRREWNHSSGQDRSHDRLADVDETSFDDPFPAAASTGIVVLRLVAGLLAIVPLPVLGAIQLAHVGRWS